MFMCLQQVLKKNTSVFSYCSVLQHRVLPLSETLCFNSCLFKAPPPEYIVSSDWSAQTHLNHHQSPHYLILE